MGHRERPPGPCSFRKNLTVKVKKKTKQLDWSDGLYRGGEMARLLCHYGSIGAYVWPRMLMCVKTKANIPRVMPRNLSQAMTVILTSPEHL